jgi:hypothetical protein
MPGNLTPIFLFSLPRSGSTLLQRILATHDQVATAAEPHLLLPLIYTFRRDGIYTDYQHEFLVPAVEEFCAELPHGRDDFNSEVREFVLRLYARAAKTDKKTCRYFLDKTPRYNAIVEEVIELFPDAKIIFLWRQPLAIVASIIDSWDNGRWTIFRYKRDLFRGLINLLNAQRRFADKCFTVRYEDFIAQPETELGRLLAYLELDLDLSLLTRFTEVKFNTRYERYHAREARYGGAVSAEPLGKWKQMVGNPLRRMWCRRYLRVIGKNRLKQMGYDYNHLNKELNGISFNLRFVGSDSVRMIYGVFRCAFELPLLRRKFTSASEWHQVVAHT